MLFLHFFLPLWLSICDNFFSAWSTSSRISFSECFLLMNFIGFCFWLKMTHLCLQFTTFPFCFQKSVKLSCEWKGKIPALVKSPDLLEDNVSFLIKEKMFQFCFFFTHLSTIQNSVNNTFNIMILKLLKSLVSSCNLLVLLLHFQRWCEMWSLLMDVIEESYLDNFLS